MKRKILSLLLCLILSASICLSASANSELPRIVDEADLLTEEEESILEEASFAFRTEYELDAVVLTVDSLGGKSIAAYANDYYDYNGYGVGYDYSGLILVVAMEERELYISTCGKAISRFTDDELDTIINGTAYWLSEGDYYDAFDAFFGLTPLYADEYVVAYPDHVYNEHDSVVEIVAPEVNWLLSILIGAVTAGIALFFMVSAMNTKRRQHSAGDYLRPGSYHLRTRQDVFLYSNISKVRRQQNNGGSHGGGHGGGGSVHRSSSGRSHGGRGGRF